MTIENAEKELGLRIRQIDILSDDRYHHRANRQLEQNDFQPHILIRRKGQFFNKVLIGGQK